MKDLSQQILAFLMLQGGEAFRKDIFSKFARIHGGEYGHNNISNTLSKMVYEKQLSTFKVPGEFHEISKYKVN